MVVVVVGWVVELDQLDAVPDRGRGDSGRLLRGRPDRLGVRLVGFLGWRRRLDPARADRTDSRKLELARLKAR